MIANCVVLMMNEILSNENPICLEKETHAFTTIYMMLKMFNGDKSYNLLLNMSSII